MRENLFKAKRIDNIESQKDIIAVGWNVCIDAITGGENSDD